MGDWKQGRERQAWLQGRGSHVGFRRGCVQLRECAKVAGVGIRGRDDEGKKREARGKRRQVRSEERVKASRRAVEQLRGRWWWRRQLTRGGSRSRRGDEDQRTDERAHTHTGLQRTRVLLSFMTVATSSVRCSHSLLLASNRDRESTREMRRELRSLLVPLPLS